MKTFVNWGNGREKDFELLLPIMPEEIERMVVPFLGNGDVLLNVKAKAYVAGDKCDELVDLWRFVSRPQPLLIDMLQTIMECWDNLPQFYRPIEDRLFEVYDNYALGALGDYISLVAAVGRVVKDFNVSDSIPETLKGWCIDEMRTELRYRLVKAIEAGRHLGMNHDKKFRRRMLTAVQNAYYEYLVYLYNNQQVKKQAQTAILLWTLSISRGHSFIKDDCKWYTPVFAGTDADGLAYRTTMQTLLNDEFYARMKFTQLFKKDAVTLLNCEQPGPRDFIFADPPCIVGTRKKRGRIFTRETQQKLADFLLNLTPARWMAILPQEDPVIEEYLAKDVHSMVMGDELVMWNY